MSEPSHTDDTKAEFNNISLFLNNSQFKNKLKHAYLHQCYVHLQLTVYRQVQEIKGCSIYKYSPNSRCHLSSRLLSVLAMLMPIVHVFLPRRTSEMFHHFVLPTKTTQSRLQVFSVNCSIIWQFCPTIDTIFHILQNSSKFRQHQLVKMN